MWKRLTALTAAGLVLTAPTALAGGPTSAIVVDPSTGKSASLYHSDADYQPLMEALGPRPPAPDGPDLHGAPSTTITVTWLMHDVEPWRIDHVIENDGGLWVETIEPNGDHLNFDQHGVIHKAANPQALQALLDHLVSKPKTATAIPVSAQAPSPTPAPDGLHWGSLLAGMAVGALVVVAFTVVRRRRQPA